MAKNCVFFCRKITLFLIHSTVFLSLIACYNNIKDERIQGQGDAFAQLENHDPSENEEFVKYVTLTKKAFFNELLANGKVKAKRKANLVFENDGFLKKITVKEGDRVQAGQLIAFLEDNEERLKISSAELAYKQAVLDYQDQLLRAGYRLSDSNKIDIKVKEIAKLRSGLNRSEIELQQANYEFEQTRLPAPFAGKVANVKAKPQNSSRAYEFICTLIDDSSFEVDFQVLEQELSFIKQASTVSIIPFSNNNTTVSGRIVSINPLIDDAGMVSVKAFITGGSGLLLDGMSVRVKVRERKDNQLVVPKEAVVDRSGRKVVFTLVDSLAKWNYVEIAGENSSSFAIKSGLDVGDKVIYEKNFNLAHDKPVKVANEL